MDISNEGPVFNYMLINKLAKSFFGGTSPQWNVFPVLRKWVCFGKVAVGEAASKNLHGNGGDLLLTINTLCNPVHVYLIKNFYSLIVCLT
jgi:hypothetical protein